MGRELFALIGSLTLILSFLYTNILTFNSLRNYFTQSDAIVFVVDSADTPRMEECGTELQ